MSMAVLVAQVYELLADKFKCRELAVSPVASSNNIDCGLFCLPPDKLEHDGGCSITFEHWFYSFYTVTIFILGNTK